MVNIRLGLVTAASIPRGNLGIPSFLFLTIYIRLVICNFIIPDYIKPPPEVRGPALEDFKFVLLK